MGPREALEQISAMIRVALASNDIAAVHALLRDMQTVTERAISFGTLRRAKLVRMATAG
jgi:predicted dinucleotide-binding enzyme